MKNSVKESLGRVVYANKDALIGIALTCGVMGFAKLFGVPINISNGTISTANLQDRYKAKYGFYMPRNMMETAIRSIADDAVNMTLDNDKVREARRIEALIQDINEPCYDTVEFAITELTRIKDTLIWDSNKKEINSMITNLATIRG